MELTKEMLAVNVITNALDEFALSIRENENRSFEVCLVETLFEQKMIAAQTARDEGSNSTERIRNRSEGEPVNEADR